MDWPLFLSLSRVSCSPGWPWTHYMAQDDVELLSFNLQNSVIWRYIPQHQLVHVVLEIDLMASWTVGKHDINGTISPIPHFLLFLCNHRILEDGLELLDSGHLWMPGDSPQGPGWLQSVRIKLWAPYWGRKKFLGLKRWCRVDCATIVGNDRAATYIIYLFICSIPSYRAGV